MRRFVLLCSLMLAIALHGVRPAGAAWNPEVYRDLGTLEIQTVGVEEGEHWSTLWLVVVDGQVYLRLGSRAADRVAENTTAPIVKVRVGGELFERVRAEPAPDMVERVADAMAEKYTSDLLVRFFPHPMTIRLVPEGQ
jgi:hypothetical protein